jgi:hypothetical protein
LALGAVSQVSLGKDIHAEVGGRNWQEPQMTYLQVTAGGDTQRIDERESKTIGGYEVYLERPFLDGVPGKHECAAIYESGNIRVRNSAIRSAVIMAHQFPDLTDWSGMVLPKFPE